MRGFALLSSYHSGRPSDWRLTWKPPSSLTYSAIVSRSDEAVSVEDGRRTLRARDVVSRSSENTSPGISAGLSGKHVLISGSIFQTSPMCKRFLTGEEIPGPPRSPSEIDKGSKNMASVAGYLSMYICTTFIGTSCR